MTLLILILAMVALTAVSWIAVAVVDYVRNDGYGRPSPRTPPRSHHTDPFDPRSRLA